MIVQRDRPAAKELYRRLARNMAYLASGTGAAALFNMLALAFNVRALSPTEFGLLVMLQASALTLGGLMSFATQQPVIQLGLPAFHDGDWQRLGQIVGLGLACDVVAALLASTAAFLIILFGGTLIGISDEQTGIANIFAASLLFTGYLTSNGLFRLLDRFALLSVIQAGVAAAMLGVSALFYYLDAGLTAYVWMWAGFMALGSQIQLWTALFLIRKSGVRVSPDYRSMRREDIRTFLAYCWTTWGTSSIDTVRTNADSVLVGAIVAVEAAGVYNVAKQVAGILRKLTSIYASAAFPEISRLAAHNDFKSARRLRTRMVIIGGGVGAAGVLVAALGGFWLLEAAFGPPFAMGYWALVVLTAAAGLQLIAFTFSMYVQVFLGPIKLFHIYILSTLVFIVSAPPLASWLGMVGAAVAQILFVLALVIVSHLSLRMSALLRPEPAD